MIERFDEALVTTKLMASFEHYNNSKQQEYGAELYYNMYS